MPKVLVTGGAGFIGSHLVDRLVADGLEVGVLDNSTEHDWKSARGGRIPRVHRGDIVDREFVRKAVEEYDVIFHEAAVVPAGMATTDVASLHATNVDGTLNLLDAASRSRNRRFVYASSAAVYGETESGPIKEDRIPNPTSPYGFSKLEGEKYCRFFASTYGLRTVCLRYFNVYGPRQKLGSYSGVISAFIRKLARGESPVIFGDGAQTRDFVHVNDVVEANVLASKANLRPGETFNISTGTPTSISQLAVRLCQLSGKADVKPLHAPIRSGDLRHSCGDFGKAKRELGFTPRVQLYDGLKGLFGLSERGERQVSIPPQA